MRVAALLLVGACGFAKLPKLGGGDDAPGMHDAPVDVVVTPDAGVCVTASVECASADTLRTCSAAGMTAVDTTCSWGCLTTGTTAHCGLLAPTGGGVTTTDTDTTTLATLGDVTIPAGVTINGDNGAIGSVRAAGTGIISGIDYKISSTGIAVFRMKSLDVAADTMVIGTHAVAIVTDTSARLDGVVNASGTCAPPLASPGGFAGGSVSQSGGGPGGGRSPAGACCGGGGGGFSGIGGAGGGPNMAMGGPTYGTPAMTMLVGGSGGGGGTTSGALGGNGGGVFQLITNGALTISAAGGVNAGGCGGQITTGGSAGGGGGGGAGGAIVLEGKTINVLGGLAVNGGGGGGGGNGVSPGQTALLTRSPASGGSSNNGGFGGNGGTGAVAAQPGQGSLVGGGGGGSVGRIRVNTPNAAATLGANAILSPGPNDPNTTFTQGPTQVQ